MDLFYASRMGDMKKVQYFVEEEKVDVNAKMNTVSPHSILSSSKRCFSIRKFCSLLHLSLQSSRNA